MIHCRLKRIAGQWYKKVGENEKVLGENEKEIGENIHKSPRTEKQMSYSPNSKTSRAHRSVGVTGRFFGKKLGHLVFFCYLCRPYDRHL